MKTAIIVQARMTSTRLPGKVLCEVLGKPLLTWQIERLQRVQRADGLLIATTTNATDEPIVRLVSALGIPVFRGSEADVLQRYYGAAKSCDAQTIVRVTSDCPLIDPAVIDRGLELAATSGADYVSNTVTRSFPRGMDTEVFSFAALEAAHLAATDPAEREHVTPHLYRHPEKFRLEQFTMQPDESAHRWTVDTPEDLELVRRMLEALADKHPDFSLSDCLALHALYPDWRMLNAHIEQKKT